MPKPKIRARLITLAVAGVLICADQWLKVRLRWVLAPPTGQAKTLVPGVIGLRYTENTGISFSLFGDSQAIMYVISIVTGLVMLAGIVALLLGRIGGAVPLSAAALILAGGLGNLIDRLMNGYVVDYIELLFMRFAVFNFADICITCGVVLLMGWILWDEARRRKTAVKT